MSDLNKNENKNNFIGNFKASFSGRKFRSGAYVTLVSTVVIIIVFVVNMLLSKMDIQFDLSSQNMYSLTEDTTKMVKNIKDDITIYYMVQSGNETAYFEEVAKRYDSLSDHITLESKDPVLYPKFASKYVEDEITDNSFLIVNNTKERAKYLSSNDLVVKELNYQTYEENITGLDVEGKLTSALLYVTSEELPVMYVVEGHGEVATGDLFTNSMDKMNIKVQTLSTLTTGEIPADCDMLYINTPEKDFSAEEAAMIKAYLSAGGKAIINVDYRCAELTNLMSILDYYGVGVQGGVILEGDKNKHLTNNPQYLVPDLASNAITTQAKTDGIPVLMLYSSGLTISDTKRSSLTIEPLMSTSASAYLKGVTATTTEKEAGDVTGSFHLGLVATDTFNNVTSTVVVFSSGSTFDQSTLTYGNKSLLTGTMGYLAGDMETVSIPTKSLAKAKLYPTQQHTIIWGAITVVLIPVLILVVGILISLRRRRK